MKVFIFVLAVFIHSGSALAEVRPEYSGSWYNPDQSGHGFSVEVLSTERSIAYWFTYDPFGNPIFLYADGT